jgi:hypothetical protein
MRVLPLLVLTAAELCAADPASESERGHAFEELVLTDLHRPFPTDAELSQRLVDHRKDFEQLVAMAKADNELVRIAPDFTWTTSSVAWPRPDSELGFTPQRWDEYRHLFRALGLEAGILRPRDHRNTVYLLVQTKGLVTGGSTKGYAYSDTALEPRCNSLDKPIAVHTEICFKPLGGMWYLYLEQD